MISPAGSVEPGRKSDSGPVTPYRFVVPVGDVVEGASNGPRSRPNSHQGGRPRMVYAGLDIHKAVFQTVVLDPDPGELSESRFEPSRERLDDWAMHPPAGTR